MSIRTGGNIIASKGTIIQSGGSSTWGSITGTLSNQTDLQTALDGKQATISDLATIRSGAASGATAVQPSSLATVATSGSYNDLSNQPTIPTVNNSTISFTQGGTSKGSFTLNQVSGTTIALDAADVLSVEGRTGAVIVIDDNKGTGDTDYTWSADKLDTTIGNLETLINNL